MGIRVGTGIFFMLIVSVLASEAVAASPWVSDGAEPSITANVEVPWSETRTCPEALQIVEVVGVGQVRACPYGTRASVVAYQHGAGWSLGRLGSPDGDYYAIKGWCDGGDSCLYSEAHDMLITRRFVGGYSYALEVYPGVSKRLTLRREGSLTATFQRVSTEQPTVVAGVDGQAILVNAVGISRNGRWLIAELTEKGIVRIDLATLDVRRIIAPGYIYGRGLNPMYHLAITDDGRTAFASGQNSGFGIISVDERCGSGVSATTVNSWGHGGSACPTSLAGISSVLPQFQRAWSPYFDSSGRTLTVSVLDSRQGYRHIMIRPPWLSGVAPVPYLALGDSFTSGEGETDEARYLPYTDTVTERCHTSDRSYPYIAFAAARNVACSGAMMIDIRGAQDYRGQGKRLAHRQDYAAMQHDALEQLIPGRIAQKTFVELYRPAITTISIGGNDAGLIDKLEACAMPDECFWVSPEGRLQTKEEILALHPRLIQLLSELDAIEPSRRLVVIGYPMIIDSGGQCDPVTAWLFSSAERQYMNEVVSLLNDVIRSAAQSVRIEYVSIQTAYDDHELCGALKPAAMNGFRLGRDVGVVAALPFLNFIRSESFHPTPYGHRLVGAILADVLKRAPVASQLTPEPVTPRDYWPAGSVVERQVRVGRFIQQSEGRVMVSLPPESFDSSSNVTVEIRSRPEVVARTVADSDGGLSLTAVLPSTLVEGYHTLLVHGETEQGRSVSYYQSFATERNPKVSAHVSVSDVPREKSVGLPSVATLSVQPAAILGDAKETQAELHSGQVHRTIRIHLTLLLLTLLGIMAIWLLFGRRLKK